MTMRGHVEQSGFSNLTIILFGFFVLCRSLSNNVLFVLLNQPINNRRSTLCNSKGPPWQLRHIPPPRQLSRAEIVTNQWPMPLEVVTRIFMLVASWQLIMKCFNLVTNNFMHCSISKMKELFPSNYQLNTCLQGNTSKQQQPLYFSMILCCCCGLNLVLVQNV